MWVPEFATDRFDFLRRFPVRLKRSINRAVVNEMDSTVLRKFEVHLINVSELREIDHSRKTRRCDLDYKSYRRSETFLSIRFALVPNYFYSFELDYFII
jgi:hypothetical protein